MLASISPFGERARGQRWGTTVSAYLVASTLGGALVGGVLAVAGAALVHVTGAGTTTRLVVLAALGFLGLGLDAGIAGTHLPGPHRQVDERWLGAYRGWAYGAGFGIQLGAAFTTIVPASITYLAFACALLSGSLGGGVVVGATFGLVRALPLLVNGKVHDPTTLRDRMRFADEALPVARRASTLTQLSFVVVALGAAVVGVGA
jgi:hypothetical protein